LICDRATVTSFGMVRLWMKPSNLAESLGDSGDVVDVVFGDVKTSNLVPWNQN
jgi:hypothetical protein